MDYDDLVDFEDLHGSVLKDTGKLIMKIRKLIRMCRRSSNIMTRIVDLANESDTYECSNARFSCKVEYNLSDVKPVFKV